ncbi:DSC E3 ubiquitin ligase complex subunit 3 C-terminal domain-containing protein [Pseudoscourfieldia marina]
MVQVRVITAPLPASYSSATATAPSQSQSQSQSASSQASATAVSTAQTQQQNAPTTMHVAPFNVNLAQTNANARMLKHACVDELRKRGATVDANRLRIIASGKLVGPDEALLSALGIRDGATVHAVALPQDAPRNATAATTTHVERDVDDDGDESEAASIAAALSALRGGNMPSNVASDAEIRRFLREQMAALRAFERQRNAFAARGGAENRNLLADDSDDDVDVLGSGSLALGGRRESADCLVGVMMGFFLGFMSILCLVDRGLGRRFKLGIFIGATLNAVVGVARAVSGPQHSHNILPTQSHRHTFSSILDEHW